MTSPEDFGDLGIHVNHHVLLCLDLVISLLHLRLDPQGERVPNNRVYDVRDILAGKLLDLLINREVLVDAWVLFGKRLHILDG